LALQVKLKLGDVGQDIEEMADLCDELLSSDSSTDFLTKAIIAFGDTVLDQTITERIPSEKVTWRYAESRTGKGFVVCCPVFRYSISEVWEAGVSGAGDRLQSYLA